MHNLTQAPGSNSIPALALRSAPLALAKSARTLLALASIAFSQPAMSSDVAVEQRVRVAMDEAARGYLADHCRVGLSVAARVQGESFLYHYGSVRRERVETPTSDSVYELASVTKTFVGALAARALVERRMTLDGDFRADLPDRYPNLEAAGQPITLRSLATHTSGLQRDLPDSDALLAKPDFDRIGRQFAALNKGFDRAHSLAALHEVALRSTPGERFAYSNLGTRVIGYGLETVYRMPLDRLLHVAILDRLGMTDTTFSPNRAMRARRVVPYSRRGHVQPYHDSSAGAAYGLYSTPRDMARYLVWQLDDRDPVIARAHAPIRGTAADGEGLIWNLGESGDAPIVWHGGGSFGQTSQMVLFPQDQQGYVLLANDACEGSESALKAIAASVRDALRGDGDTERRTEH